MQVARVLAMLLGASVALMPLAYAQDAAKPDAKSDAKSDATARDGQARCVRGPGLRRDIVGCRLCS